jgi:hypothetical protein
VIKGTFWLIAGVVNPVFVGRMFEVLVDELEPELVPELPPLP